MSRKGWRSPYKNAILLLQSQKHSGIAHKMNEFH